MLIMHFLFVPDIEICTAITKLKLNYLLSKFFIHYRPLDVVGVSPLSLHRALLHVASPRPNQLCVPLLSRQMETVQM